MDTNVQLTRVTAEVEVTSSRAGRQVAARACHQPAHRLLLRLADRRPLLLALLLLSGCAHFGPARQQHHRLSPAATCTHPKPAMTVTRQNPALTIASMLLSPHETNAARHRLIATVQRRYHKHPSAENQLALAVVYAVSDQGQGSDRKALALLNKLDTRHLSYSSRTLARWMSSMMRHRDKLEQGNAALEQQLDSTKESLANDRKEIKTLARIESKIGPAP